MSTYRLAKFDYISELLFGGDGQGRAERKPKESQFKVGSPAGPGGGKILVQPSMEGTVSLYIARKKELATLSIKKP